MITQNDHPGYVKHVLGCIYLVFSPIWVLRYGGGVSKGLVHNLIMQLFTLGSSKIEVFQTFFLILWSPKMTIQGM